LFGSKNYLGGAMLVKVIAIAAMFGLLGWATPNVVAQSMPAAPLPHRCVGVGPVALDDLDFCGCTWGEVYYRGQPVAKADVILKFGTRTLTTLAQIQPVSEHTFPFYSTSGVELGAKRGDILTLTVSYAGESTERIFRALPDGDKEQHVPLVLPEHGQWSSWLTGGYTRTLVSDGATLWAGGPAGLLAITTSTNISAVQSLPWPQPAVIGVAVAPNGNVWAAGPHHLAERVNGVWQDRTVPFAATMRGLLVHPNTGALWVGGGDTTAALAVYDGAWHTVSAVSALITTLVADSANNVWVSAWGDGVYRHAGDVSDLASGWTRYKVSDGLASNYVLSSAAKDQTIWFGTQPYLAPQGALGGVSRYNLTDNSWHSYTVTQGLAADTTLQQAPTTIYALAVDGSGVPWIGTSFGVQHLATSELWITDTVASTGVRALASNGTDILMAETKGTLFRFESTVTPGHPPIAVITATQAITLVQPFDRLALSASASDQDANPNESQDQILAWDWQSDRDGPLCTTANTCSLDTGLLTAGRHTISLRVQDDEGVWSQPVTTTVTILKAQSVYLPVVRK
jgi:hypothetical protein